MLSWTSQVPPQKNGASQISTGFSPATATFKSRPAGKEEEGGPRPAGGEERVLGPSRAAEGTGLDLAHPTQEKLLRIGAAVDAVGQKAPVGRQGHGRIGGSIQVQAGPDVDGELPALAAGAHGGVWGLLRRDPERQADQERRRQR